jgi:uncharacterized phage protein (TIGR01671 family)
MNREIKFEYGFQSVNGILKKVYYLHEIPNIKEKCDLWSELPIAYVRQFTGLHDKNGQEIYEGDIITTKPKESRWNHLFCKMVFNENTAKFEAQQYWLSKNKYIGLSNNHDYYEYEIIGNIHQNPELLQP